METFLAQTAVTVATEATSKTVDLAVTSNNSETIKRSIATQAKRQVSFANAQHQRQQASVNDRKRAANTQTATQPQRSPKRQGGSSDQAPTFNSNNNPHPQMGHPRFQPRDSLATNQSQLSNPRDNSTVGCGPTNP
jgi:Arc/MetJ family transcription regulator